MTKRELTDEEWKIIHVTGSLGSRLNEPPDESFPADDPWAEGVAADD